jgi:colanic acid/amylovoran biosynthesis glycosyltransferase
MKIAIVVDNFPTVSETWVVNHICSLIDEGFDVTILAFSKGNTVSVHESILNYNLLDKTIYFQYCNPDFANRFKLIAKLVFSNLISLNFYTILQCLNIFKSLKSVFNLSNFYLSQWFILNSFDVIHAHYGHNGAFVSNLKSKKILKKKTKILTSFHGYDLWPSEIVKLRKTYEILKDNCDALLVNSEYSKQLLINIIGENSKMVILPVSTNTDFFKRKSNSIKKSFFNIVFCGRLVEVKGPELCLDILKLFIERNPSNNIKLTFVGDGELREKLIEKINILNLKEKVVLVGAKTPLEVLDIYNNSDLFLLPGIHEEKTQIAETQGVVIQEAQSCELPVLVSNIGGMKYGLINGMTGFTVEEKNVNSFVEKLEFLFYNENERLQMGKSGRSFVVANFDSNVIKKRLLNLYYK